MTDVSIEGRRLRLSNLDRVLYPETGFTKADFIDYYVRIAPALLPHLRDRPLTLKRYPDGVTGNYFYEKRCPSHRPQWVPTASVWSEGDQNHVDYCVVNDLPTLIWTANLADLELHTSLSYAHNIQAPSMVVFDLDPGAPADVLQCAQVSLLLRDLFAQLNLKCFIKTSGSKGMQLYIPLNTPVTYDQTKPFARAVAELMERRYPTLIVSNMKKELRTGKVLIDWSQNDAHKTTVCVYSLRAKARPTVSTPVRWEEVDDGYNQGDRDAFTFGYEDVIARVERHGDLFSPVLTMHQRLPTV